MQDDKVPVIPLHMHPGFQDRHRVNELKNMLLAETLAFAQVALDNAAGPAGVSARAEKILQRACVLLEEARDRLVLEML
jgi:hypothetical protein